MSNVASTLLPFLAKMLPLSAIMSNEISSFRQSQNKLNNVEAAFDTVERIVQLVAFDNVASTLLLVLFPYRPFKTVKFLYY